MSAPVRINFNAFYQVDGSKMSIPNTERGRIARIVENAQNCAKAGALARARAMYGSRCTGCSDNSIKVSVPSESSYLSGTVTPCYVFKGPEPAVPESVRLARLTQTTADQSMDPFNLQSRFSEFRRPYFPVICPPIPQEALNANVPKNLLQTCPLPNKPFNLSLP